MAFLIGVGFPVLDLTLVAIAARLDSRAALALIPYLLYRPYAVYWAYALWQQNDGPSR
jgi:tryptophan-rich sensory protein